MLRGRRRRRAVDDDLQPGPLHARPARRALAGGRLRSVRLRAGRRDDRGRTRARPHLGPRQRRIRSRALRRSARHSAHVHPARRRLEAPDRPARGDLSPSTGDMLSTGRLGLAGCRAVPNPQTAPASPFRRSDAHLLLRLGNCAKHQCQTGEERSPRLAEVRETQSWRRARFWITRCSTCRLAASPICTLTVT